MIRSAVIITAVLVAGLATACTSRPRMSDPPPSARELTERRCGSCHAIDLTGASPHPDAPPLRDMFKRYPIYALDEAFQKGIEVSHRDMPRFTLSREEAVAIRSYLDSLNPCASPSSDDASMERCFGPM
jgi:mono/diheme cytochrome c family protein